MEKLEAKDLLDKIGQLQSSVTEKLEANTYLTSCIESNTSERKRKNEPSNKSERPKDPNCRWTDAARWDKD